MDGIPSNSPHLIGAHGKQRLIGGRQIDAELKAIIQQTKINSRVRNRFDRFLQLRYALQNRGNATSDPREIAQIERGRGTLDEKFDGCVFENDVAMQRKFFRILHRIHRISQNHATARHYFTRIRIRICIRIRIRRFVE